MTKVSPETDMIDHEKRLNYVLDPGSLLVANEKARTNKDIAKNIFCAQIFRYAILMGIYHYQIMHPLTLITSERLTQFITALVKPYMQKEYGRPELMKPDALAQKVNVSIQTMLENEFFLTYTDEDGFDFLEDAKDFILEFENRLEEAFPQAADPCTCEEEV